MVENGKDSKEVRRPGAPRGNLNALKHGFYSRRFLEGEVTDLEGLFGEGLQDEIVMMKVVTRRALELSEEADTMDKRLKLLGAMGLAATRIGNLMKTQQLVFGGAGSFESALAQAIDNILAEFEDEEKGE